ncbi:MAG: tetratricopeptide repeat protein [Terrimicrobiaceae bacterium]
MALKSLKDFEAEKSPLRIVYPVVGAILVVIVLGVFVFGLNQKAPETAAVIEESTSKPPPSPEELRQIQVNDLRGNLEQAAAEQNRMTLETAALALLELEPQSGEAWSHLGRVQQSRGETKEAITSFTKAIEFSQQKAFDLYLRAGLLRAQGDLPAAIQDLEQAAQIDPSSVGIANSVMIFKIQNGGQDEVRSLVEAYERTGIRRNAQFWLLGAAAVAMQDGNAVRATRCLEALQVLIAKPLLAELLADPFFDPYRDQPDFQAFFSNSSSSQQ